MSTQIYGWSRVVAKALNADETVFRNTMLTGENPCRSEAVAQAFPGLIMPSDWTGFDNDLKGGLVAHFDLPETSRPSHVQALADICGPILCRASNEVGPVGYRQEHRSAVTQMLLSVIASNFGGGQQDIARALSMLRIELNEQIDHANNGCDCGDDDEDDHGR